MKKESMLQIAGLAPKQCQPTRQKPTAEHNETTSLTTAKNTDSKSGQNTNPIETLSLRDWQNERKRNEAKPAQNSDTRSGAEKSSNQKPAPNVHPLADSTVTIRTIQDLLTCNGSARFATVRLTESTERLIAAAPELLEALKAALPILDDATQDCRAKHGNGSTSDLAMTKQAESARTAIKLAEGK